MPETPERLKQEQGEIDGAVEAAAVKEDVAEWLRLRMRRDALPALIRQEKARPIREEIERLENELESLEEERLRVREEEPAVPARMRGYVTSSMVQNQMLGGISGQASRTG